MFDLSQRTKKSQLTLFPFLDNIRSYEYFYRGKYIFYGELFLQTGKGQGLK